MNGTQVKSFLLLTVLAIIGFGPLSVTCLIGMFILLKRPEWFYRVVKNLYRDRPCRSGDPKMPAEEKGKKATAARIKSFLCLFILLVLDIAPVPVTGAIGLYVVAARPCWFRTLVEKIYLGVNGSG